MSGSTEAGHLGETDQADDVLIEAAKQGDPEAMNRLLARHWPMVNTLCRRMVPDSFDAEDARQEALWQAARRIATFEGRSSFSTWIYAVTRNVCLNEIQKAARRASVSFDDSNESIVSVPDESVRTVQRLDVDAALRQVSAPYHAVLVMWFFGDLSMADIAAHLDIPVNTVKTRLFKGKAQLARLLREPDDPLEMSNRGLSTPDGEGA